MAIASIGSLTAIGPGSATDNQTSLTTTVNSGYQPGRFCIVAVVTDNIASGGDDGAVTSVTITQASKATTTLTKISQVANNVAAQGGVSLSTWYGIAADTYGNNTATITATFGNSSLADASAMSGWIFSYNTALLALEASATPSVIDTVTSGLPSMSLNGLPATNRVRFRASGMQIGAGNILTATSGYSAITGAQSATTGTTGEVTLRGEFVINALANGTSAPTMVGSFLSVSQYIAINEVPTTATLAVTEGPDTVAINGVSTAFTTLAVTEGADTVAFNARSTAFAALAVTEGADTIFFNVAGVGGPNNSNLVVTEGPDIVVIAADFSYSIALDAVEDGDTVIFDLTNVDPSPPPIIHEVLRFGRPAGRW